MFLEKNGKKIAAALTAFSAIMNVTLYFVLPKSLVMQVTLSGEAGTTLPSVFGLSLLFIGMAFFSYKIAFDKDEKEKRKWLAGAAIVFAVNILTAVFNL